MRLFERSPLAPSGAPRAQRPTQRWLCLLLAALVVGLSACDSLDPSPHARADLSPAQRAAAQSWFEAQTSSLGKSGDDALRRFYPDWDKGTLVTTPGGQQAVVTTVWRDYEVRYDSAVYFLRVLAVVLKPDGSVERGHLVEFASPYAIAPDDGPSLAERWLAGAGFEHPTKVVTRSVTYEFESGFYHAPGRTPAAFTLENRLCEVEGLGKAMATAVCAVESVVDGYVCMGWEMDGSDEQCWPRWGERQICWNAPGGGGGGEPDPDKGGGGSTGDPGYSTPGGFSQDLKDLAKAIIGAIANGDRFDDPALWRRLLGAYSPQAGQCVDAAVGVAASGSMNAQQFAAVVNCAATYFSGFDATDLVKLLDTVPSGLERVAQSAAGTDIYGVLVQMARDNPSALHTIAQRASNLSDVYVIGRLSDTSNGTVHNLNITVLTATEALERLGSVNGTKAIWIGPDGVQYSAWAYPVSSERSGNKPSIEISPCPTYLGIDCSYWKKVIFRFNSF